MIATEQVNVTVLPIGALHPNDYNPNRMTPEEFSELVSEVKHLGRLPKPVVVRANTAGYLIIDGEHTWRAAQEAGLAEIPCEVIEADAFEAMRQTYKRNQHGTHNPVLLGRMFKRMMQERGLSQRDLAAQIEVSEGTIRNTLEFAKAADVRNDYAFDRLSVKQVRYYNRLPRRIGNLWLDCGAEIKALYGFKNDRDVEQIEAIEEAESDLARTLEYRESTGLVEFLPRPRTPTGFESAMKQLREWDKWERGWVRGGIKRKELRSYTRQHFEGNFRVREQSEMDGALGLIIDTAALPPVFLLAPDEFERILAESALVKESHIDFLDRLRVAIAQRTGRIPKREWRAKDALVQIEIDQSAPDYIKASPLPVRQKYALWKAEGPDPVKREIALNKRLDCGDKETEEQTVKRHIQRKWKEVDYKAKIAAMSEVDLARAIAERLHIYDKPKDAENIQTLVDRLCVLTKTELMILNEYTADMQHFKEEAKMIAQIIAQVRGR